MVLFLRFFNIILSVMRPKLIPFGIYIKWKFLVIFLLATLTTFLIHLGWTKWLLSVPQPLPQQSTISTGKKNSLERGIYYETSVPITDTANHILANYRIWIPNGVETLRGVIVRQHGCGGEGLVYANDLHWQALAIKHQLAILGTKYQTVGIYPDDPCDSWAVIDRGSEDAFLKSLNEFGQKSRHPELGKLPWVLWGYSGGADWAVQMSHKYPDRTIALIAMRGGGVNISHSEPLKLLTSDINPNVLGMPVLYALGADEAVGTIYFSEGLDLPRQVFSRFRKAGALWGLALEADMGHGSTDTRLIAIPYLDTILTIRLTKDSQKLRQLHVSQGWLANPDTHEIASFSNYKGDPLHATWLPNEETAYKWHAYVSNPNLFEKARYSFCSHKSFVTLIGAPHLYQSCYPNRVSPTRKPNAPDDLRAVRIGATEVVLNWDFTPDLENGLPKFRVYRNNALIATLQGQERDGGDAPIYPHIVLEFRDKAAGENDIYAVSAFNSLGENISQSASIIP
jgi:pimeloyl-ACP methyl ester carboxylesterase